MHTMTRRLLASLFCLACARIAHADEELPFECRRSTEQGTFSGFQVTEENDSIIGKGGGDQRYTQGLRLVFNYHRNAVPCFVQSSAHAP